jgi:hypothetical protein
MNTVLGNDVVMFALYRRITVFMGSGFAASRAPE